MSPTPPQGKNGRRAGVDPDGHAASRCKRSSSSRCSPVQNDRDGDERIGRVPVPGIAGRTLDVPFPQPFHMVPSALGGLAPGPLHGPPLAGYTARIGAGPSRQRNYRYPERTDRNAEGHSSRPERPEIGCRCCHIPARNHRRGAPGQCGRLHVAAGARPASPVPDHRVRPSVRGRAAIICDPEQVERASW